MKWMKTEDPEFRVPVPAPEAFGGWPFYFLVHPIYCFYFTLGAPLLPGAGIGTWNLGTRALPFLLSGETEIPKFRGAGSASTFRAPFRNLGTRRLGFHWELEAGAGIPMWSLERAWGSQFRNSENGIAVPLLHCRYTQNAHPQAFELAQGGDAQSESRTAHGRPRAAAHFSHGPTAAPTSRDLRRGKSDAPGRRLDELVARRVAASAI
jgi:hypothetical protein